MLSASIPFRCSLSIVLLLSLQSALVSSFLSPTIYHRHRCSGALSTATLPTLKAPYISPSPTSLNVWWFGGTETAERVEPDQDSCELVAVRIERTSPNSRRILGEIVAPVPIDDVWAILTDYDRLAMHVPNLVESRITQRPGRGEPGDGSYQCRLYQKGAQKIIGFEFAASLTMEMKENIKKFTTTAQSTGAIRGVKDERSIAFKCVDSFFFQEFDGEWKVEAKIGADGQPETLLSYFVDVRPKGPVPVAALEWRIRQDVPTNLRAVKRAAMEVGYDGVIAWRESQRHGSMRRQFGADSKQQQGTQGGSLVAKRLYDFWDNDETMAAYLK